MSLLNVGVTAISTAQLGLATTQHNIANANTPGYSRQSIMQSTNVALITGAGAVGQGVHVDTIQRAYNSVLTSQLNTAQTQASALSTYHSMISRIDNLLADSTSGLSPVLQEFFAGVQDVAANPTLVSARQSMVSAGQALVTRFQTLEGRLTQLYDEVNTQINDTVGVINTYAKQIATLNEKIVALSSGVGQPPNDLLDQRDQLVLELNKLVKVSTVEDSQGFMNVFIGNGQQLVVGNQVAELEARPSADEPEKWVVARKGSPTEFPDDYLTGGSLGGLLSFRSEALDTAANSLGQVAVSLALTFNAQHALGQDLFGNNSNTGGSNFIADFFKLADPKVVTSTSNQAVPATNLSVTFTTPLPQDANGNFYTNVGSSDYRLERIGNTGTNDYQLVRLSDGQTWTGNTVADISTLVSTSEGITIGFGVPPGGAPAVGDSFLIQPTREAARNITVNTDISADVRKIAAAAPVRTQASSNNTGAVTITQGVVSPGYSTAGLPVTLSIVDNAGVLEVQGFPGGPATYTTGMTIAFNGMSFQMTGTAKAGDQFTIESNVGGVADSRNAVKLGGLQTANTTAGGAATYQVSYSQMVSEIGTLTRQAEVNSEAQQTLLEQTQQSRDALSGVNLDEEAANLIKFQQYYQAAARMMDTAAKLFDELLAIGR